MSRHPENTSCHPANTLAKSLTALQTNHGPEILNLLIYPVLFNQVNKGCIQTLLRSAILEEM